MLKASQAQKKLQEEHDSKAAKIKKDGEKEVLAFREMIKKRAQLLIENYKKTLES